jgi:hypothetical protein
MHTFVLLSGSDVGGSALEVDCISRGKAGPENGRIGKNFGNLLVGGGRGERVPAVSAGGERRGDRSQGTG